MNNPEESKFLLRLDDDKQSVTKIQNDQSSYSKVKEIGGDVQQTTKNTKAKAFLELWIQLLNQVPLLDGWLFYQWMVSSNLRSIFTEEILAKRCKLNFSFAVKSVILTWFLRLLLEREFLSVLVIFTEKEYNDLRFH